MSNFASIEDVNLLYREIAEAETPKVEALLEIISNILRCEAEKYGSDLEMKALESDAYADVLKSVTVDILARCMKEADNEQLAQYSQYSESALGYTISGSPLNAGGGIFIKKNELARLGLRRQKIGGLDLC